MTNAPITIDLTDETQEFYTALGKALTQWQSVEAHLGFIFVSVVNNRNQLGANAAFHTVTSFDTRLKMTDYAITAEFQNTRALNAWKPLFKRANDRNLRRNQLVHFSVECDPKRRAGYRIRLRPSIFDVRASLRWGALYPSLNVCQIMASGNSFEKLGADLAQFLVTHIQPQL